MATIRDALLPEDINSVTQDAMRGRNAVLEVRPASDQVDDAIRIIQSCHPTHFDACLECWRNAN